MEWNFPFIVPSYVLNVTAFENDKESLSRFSTSLTRNSSRKCLFYDEIHGRVYEAIRPQVVHSPVEQKIREISQIIKK